MKTPQLQLDALRELINIGIGRAAGLLNEMLRTHIELHVPQVEVLSAEEFESTIEDIAGGVTASVHLNFRGAFNGTASLVFSQDSANKLVDVLTGQSVDQNEFDEIKRGALSEIGNILDRPLSYSIPRYVENEHALRSALTENTNYEVILLGHAQFSVTEHLIRGEILLVFEIGSFQNFLTALDGTVPEMLPASR